MNNNIIVTVLVAILLALTPINKAFAVSEAGVKQTLKKSKAAFCSVGCGTQTCQGNFLVKKRPSAGKWIYALCGLTCPSAKVKNCVASGRKTYKQEPFQVAEKILNSKGPGVENFCQYACNASLCGQNKDFGRSCIMHCPPSKVVNCKKAVGPPKQTAPTYVPPPPVKILKDAPKPAAKPIKMIKPPPPTQPPVKKVVTKGTKRPAIEELQERAKKLRKTEGPVKRDIRSPEQKALEKKLEQMRKRTKPVDLN